MHNTNGASRVRANEPVPGWTEGKKSSPWSNGWTLPTAIDQRQKAFLLTIAFAVIFARAPKLILQGHVVAEEGTTYLRYAWNTAPLQAFLAPHQGYFSLFDNTLALLASRVLPLSAAALLFTWAALGVHMLACYFIISSDLVRSFAARLLALIAFLFASASIGVWLSMENSQFFFPICVTFVLIETSTVVRSSRLLLLFVAGLTGATSCALLPLFLIKAVLFRSRAIILQASVLAIAALAQGLVILHSIHAGYREPMSPHYAYVAPVLLQRIFLLPLFTNLGVILSNSFFSAHPGPFYIGLAWLVFAVLVSGISYAAFRVNRKLCAIVIAAVVTSTFNWSGCFQCDNRLFLQGAMYGTRYFYDANVFFSVSLAIYFMLATSHIAKRVSAVLLFLVLMSGAIQFPRYRTYLIHYEPWARQIAAWKQNPETQILLPPSWPLPLRLPADHPNLDLPPGVYDSSRQHRNE